MNRLTRLLVAVACAVAFPLPTKAQQSIEDHFRGKTLTVIIPTSPGGDRSANALALINHIGRHIPGNPRVVPNYMPGAGGLSALNQLANVVAKDGLTIATPLTTLIVAQVT